jgi:peptide chain release factor 2
MTGTLDDSKELLEMAAADGDEATVQSIVADLNKVEARVGKLEFQRMFSGELDSAAAFVDVQAGAGGTERVDWAEMLMRLYLRWDEWRGWKT